jgi:hypothetical protein
LNDFLISCVDFGTCPSTFSSLLSVLNILVKYEVRFLVELLGQPLDGEIWRFLNPVRDMKVLILQSISVLHFSLFILSKKVSLFLTKKSHSIIVRPTRNMSLFERRLQIKLAILHISLPALYQEGTDEGSRLWNSYVYECLFLTSEFVREGKIDHEKSGNDSFVFHRNKRFFLKIENQRNIDEWIPYEPINFPTEESFKSSSDKIDESKNCLCCYFRKT